MRIALDAMGGDYAPGPIVRGAIEAVDANPAVEIVLVGDESQILAVLGERASDSRFRIVHSTQVVGMHEKPSVLRTKRDNSISRCWELMANREVQAVVSAGNTGAVAAAGLFTRLFLRGVKRPGIAVVIPTMRGPCVLLDVGANAACRPEHLFQYGLIGMTYAKKIVGIEQPVVGLMNIGTEDGKGNDLVRETRQMFLSSHMRAQFAGNVEGRDLYQGTVNVVVCDGFVGNVILKVSEGMFDMVLEMCRQQMRDGLTTEVARAEEAIDALSDRYHHSSFGGAPLLGIDGTCIICHGGSREKAIKNALMRAVQHNDSHLNELIVQELERAPVPAAPPA